VKDIAHQCGNKDGLFKFTLEELEVLGHIIKRGNWHIYMLRCPNCGVTWRYQTNMPFVPKPIREKVHFT